MEDSLFLFLVEQKSRGCVKLLFRAKTANEAEVIFMEGLGDKNMKFEIVEIKTLAKLLEMFPYREFTIVDDASF